MVYVRNITLRILMKQLKKIEMVILFTVGVIMVVLLKLEMPFDWITDGLCHIMLIWLRNTMPILMWKFAVQYYPLSTYTNTCIRVMIRVPIGFSIYRTERSVIGFGQ